MPGVGDLISPKIIYFKKINKNGIYNLILFTILHRVILFFIQNQNYYQYYYLSNINYVLKGHNVGMNPVNLYISF